jgi:lipoate-protein ligase A
MLWFQETEMLSRKEPKYLKYKGFKMQTQRVWNIKEKMIPVVIEVAERVAKSFKKCMKAPLESKK